MRVDFNVEDGPMGLKPQRSPPAEIAEHEIPTNPAIAGFAFTNGNG